MSLFLCISFNNRVRAKSSSSLIKEENSNDLLISLLSKERITFPHHIIKDIIANFNKLFSEAKVIANCLLYSWQAVCKISSI
jgi:hypothetical protein